MPSKHRQNCELTIRPTSQPRFINRLLLMPSSEWKFSCLESNSKIEHIAYIPSADVARFDIEVASIAIGAINILTSTRGSGNDSSKAYAVTQDADLTPYGDVAISLSDTGRVVMGKFAGIPSCRPRQREREKAS